MLDFLTEGWIIGAAHSAGLSDVDENRYQYSANFRSGRALMSAKHDGVQPILAHKYYRTPSAFTQESLLRKARRQKQITGTGISPICILDPDGDMVRHLLARAEARLEPAWACYHTQLFSFSRGANDFGSVGCVGLATTLLPEWYDVDDVETLAWLREGLAGHSTRFIGGSPASATRAFLAAVPPGSP